MYSYNRSRSLLSPGWILSILWIFIGVWVMLLDNAKAQSAPPTQAWVARYDNGGSGGLS